MADLRQSTAALYQSKWSRFLSAVDPCKASVPQVAEFFLFLQQDLGISVPVVEGYRAALNHVFSLSGMDLVSNAVVSQMFRSFEKSCPPHEVWLPDWNLALVL